MIKKITSKNSFILFITAFAASVISVIFRCVNLFFFFDSDIGYYTSGAALPTVFNILLLCFALLFSVWAFTRRKDTGAVCRQSDRLIPDLAVRILLLVILIASLAFSYFDQRIQMNAPDKILFGLGCVFSMLFVSYDLKAAVGTARRSVYGLVSVLTLLFGSVSSIPSIIGCHTGALLIPASDTLYLILSIAKYYLVLAIAVFAAIRLFTSSFVNEKISAEPTETNAEAEQDVEADAEAEQDVDGNSNP